MPQQSLAAITSPKQLPASLLVPADTPKSYGTSGTSQSIPSLMPEDEKNSSKWHERDSWAQSRSTSSMHLDFTSAMSLLKETRNKNLRHRISASQRTLRDFQPPAMTRPAAKYYACTDTCDLRKQKMFSAVRSGTSPCPAYILSFSNIVYAYRTKASKKDHFFASAASFSAASFSAALRACFSLIACASLPCLQTEVYNIDRFVRYEDVYD